MSVLFNPWVLLALLLTLISTFGGGYFKGKRDENSRQQIEIAAANQFAREKEQALVAAVNAQAGQLIKVNNNAKIEIAKRDAVIASGALKLRIPIKAAECPLSASTDAAPAPRDSVQAGAEPEPAFVKSLIAITDQGDANTRQLNSCIDAYNAVYQTLKGKP